MLKVTTFEVEGPLLLQYESREDHRSLFHPVFSREELQKVGIDPDFAQEITYQVHRADTLYGIHFQNRPRAQAKLLRCARGRILDCAVDLRRNSPTYRQWVCAELSRENRRQLYIPAGFGHAALALEDGVDIAMRISCPFDPALSLAVRYNDPVIGLPFPEGNYILSEQDATAPCLAESGCNL